MDFSSCIVSQLKYLIHTLTKQNLRTHTAEIEKLLAFGLEATRFLLCHLIQEVHTANLSDPVPRDSVRLTLLSQLLAKLPKETNFISLASGILDEVQPTNGLTKCEFLASLCQSLHLSLVVQLCIGMGLCHSQNPVNRQEGIQFLKNKLGEVTPTTVRTLPDNVIHHLLHLISTTEVFTDAERTLLNLEALRQSLLCVHSGKEKKKRDTDTARLSTDIISNLSLAGVMEELGVVCTCNKEFFTTVLDQFPTLTPPNVAQAVGLMASRTQQQPTHDSELTAELQSSFLVAFTDLDQAAISSITGSTVSSWNTDVFVSVINEKYQINWRHVLRHLDFPELKLSTQRSVALILTLYKKATNEPMPVDFLLEPWRNRTAQLVFLGHIVSAPADLVDWQVKGPQARQIRVEGLPRSPTHAIWGSLDLIEMLLNLATPEHYTQIRQLFDQPVRLCVDILVMSLLQARPKLHELQRDLIRTLLPPYLTGRQASPQAGLVIPHLVSNLQPEFAQGLCIVFQEEPGLLGPIVEVAVEHRWVDTLVRFAMSKPIFAVNVALTAAARNAFNFVEWLGDILGPRKPQPTRVAFAKALLKWVEGKIRAEDERSLGTLPFPVEVTNEVFKALFDAAGKQQLPNSINEQAKGVFRDFKSITPRAPSVPLTDIANPTEPTETFSPQVEEEANTYFGQIYTGAMTVDEFIQLLDQLKNSSEKRQVDVYNCMIHNLFDEYRFFPKYPEKELQITARIMGSLIATNNLANIRVGIALRYVLQAIAKPANPKMLQFGLLALDLFKHRLPEWPQFSSHLKKIPHLEQHIPEINRYLNSPAVPTAGVPPAETAKAAEPAKTAPPAPPTARPGTAATTNPPTGAPSGTPSLPSGPSAQLAAQPFGATQDITTIMKELTRSPDVPTEVAGKIGFLMNNLMEANLDTTVQEMNKFLKQDHLLYLSQYLVVKRVSLEPNNHKLYLGIIERSSHKELETLVLNITYSSIKALLASEKIRTSTSERSLLKNIGSWLGLLTIARNKPLLHKNLNLKDLLFEALETGKLIAVVPFVAKVLEHCAESKIFKPPNPWVQGILMLLVEIHELPELKLTLKFEVEVLCKNINVNMADILDHLQRNKEKSNMPRLESIKSGIDISSSTDFAHRQAEGVRDKFDTLPGSLGMAHQSPQVSPYPTQASAGQSAQAQPEPETAEQIRLRHPGLPTLVSIHASVALLKTFPKLKPWVALAIDRAVVEIIQPVVERSVMIACTTTRELVSKDFATDLDDSKMRAAAHVMVQNLASNLAMVTCKDPLRVTMNNHLRQILTTRVSLPPGSNDTTRMLTDQIQQACEQITRDNLELGVSLVKKTATDEAVKEMDQSLEAVIEDRRKARETGQSYVPRGSAGGDTFATQQFLATLPEILRPRQGILLQHKRIYDEFAQPIRPVPEPAATSATPATGTTASPLPAQATPGSLPVGIPSDPALLHAEPTSTPGSSEEFSASVLHSLQLLQTTLKEIEAETAAHYRANPPTNPSHILSLTHSSFTQGTQSQHHERIKELVCGIHPLIREDTALLFARTIFDKVYALSEQIIAEQKGIPGQPSTELYVLMLVNEVCLFVLQTAREKKPEVVTKELTRLFLANEKRWQHKYIAVNFIRLRLINMQEFDQKLTEALQQTKSRQVVEFAGSVVQRCLVDEQLISSRDLKNTLDVLGKIAKNSQAEAAGSPTAASPVAASPPPQPAQPAPSAEAQASDRELRGVVAKLFREWIAICSGKFQSPDGSQASPQQQAMTFIGKLQQHGMLKAVQVMDRFFALLMEMSVETFIAAFRKEEEENARKKREGKKDDKKDEVASLTNAPHFLTVDAFSDLIVLLIKCCGRQNPSKEGKDSHTGVQAEVALLTKVLAVVSRVLHEDHDKNMQVIAGGPASPVPLLGFHQQPYFRFLSNLLIALMQSTADDAAPSTEMLQVFSNAFHHLSPLRLPGFAFSWLELISHRMFMPKLLLTKHQDGWPFFQRLLVDCLRFLEPSLRNAELTDAIRLFYKGTLKILLVLLHDFPEFLCNYHFSFCDVIPPSCIQLRNVILSSFPRHMRLPDPFTPNLKVDLLPEISQSPRILSKFADALKPGQPITKEEVDTYLKRRAPSPFLAELHTKLLLPPQQAQQAGSRYNIPLINALVLYVGVAAIATLQQNQTELPQATATIVDSPAMDIYHELVVQLDTEGRYLLLNALANHLRYPNNHTHYFSCVVLHLFAEAKGPQEIIQEQITRVLLERLIVNRPHPWGLLITFIELVKNPRYNFWKKAFIHCSPEIERLFDNVGQSCVGNVPKGSRPTQAAPPTKDGK
eukprot:TRINITY_DN5237_c0_g1_i1.p1 TRINITY_DN5237_c0_g1~~TRINITY_DN5237_c0_g1_i1.p1  ORF type:complete len:2313 (-),score=417.20 TRINITY_DN5237_c0_g1_i1:44-6982(-)